MFEKLEIELKISDKACEIAKKYKNKGLEKYQYLNKIISETQDFVIENRDDVELWNECFEEYISRILNRLKEILK